MKSKFYNGKVTKGANFTLSSSMLKHLGIKKGEKIYLFPSGNGTIQICAQEAALDIPVIKVEKPTFEAHEVV